MCQSIVFLSLSLSHSLLNTLYFILAQLGRANESIQLYLYMLKQHYSTLGTVNLALCLYSLIVIGVPFSDLSYERFYRQCVFQLLVVARLRRRGWRWQGGRRRRRLGVRGLLAEVGLEQGWGHSSDAEDVWSWGCFREHRSIHSSRFISAQKIFITIQFNFESWPRRRATGRSGFGCRKFGSSSVSTKVLCKQQQRARQRPFEAK